MLLQKKNTLAIFLAGLFVLSIISGAAATTTGIMSQYMIPNEKKVMIGEEFTITVPGQPITPYMSHEGLKYDKEYLKLIKTQIIPVKGVGVSNTHIFTFKAKKEGSTTVTSMGSFFPVHITTMAILPIPEWGEKLSPPC